MLRFLPMLGILSVVSLVQSQEVPKYYRDRTKILNMNLIKCQDKNKVFTNYRKNEYYNLSIDSEFGMPHIEVDFENNTFPLVFDFGNSDNILITNAISEKVPFCKKNKTYTYTPNGEIRGEIQNIEIPKFKVFNRIFENEGGTLMDWSISSTSPINGLIGLKYLQNQLFTLDYENKLLAITNRDFTFASSEKIELLSFPYHPYGIHFLGKVNGKEVIIYLDTGKSHSEINSNLVAQEDIVSDKSGSFYPELIEVEIGSKSFSLEYARVNKLKRKIDSEYPIGMYIASDILKYITLSVNRINDNNYLIFH
ncbi:hypothetical protein JEZ13_11540 [bacterium]|nr:hypothetical protein [bacterium]